MLKDIESKIDKLEEYIKTISRVNQELLERIYRLEEETTRIQLAEKKIEIIWHRLFLLEVKGGTGETK